MKIYIAIFVLLGISAAVVAPKTDTATAPTESNWRTLMKLIYRPAFDKLKKQIGTDADDSTKVDFQEVQRDALILSEFSARLHQWPDLKKFDSQTKKQQYLEKHKQLQTDVVKQHADSIYRAAKKRNIDLAKKSFVSMTQSCNVCHKLRQSSWVPVQLNP